MAQCGSSGGVVVAVDDGTGCAVVSGVTVATGGAVGDSADFFLPQQPERISVAVTMQMQRTSEDRSGARGIACACGAGRSDIADPSLLWPWLLGGRGSRLQPV